MQNKSLGINAELAKILSRSPEIRETNGAEKLTRQVLFGWGNNQR